MGFLELLGFGGKRLAQGELMEALLVARRQSAARSAPVIGRPFGLP